MISLLDVASPSRRRMRKIASWISQHGLNVIVPEIDVSLLHRGSVRKIATYDIKEIDTDYFSEE